VSKPKARQTISVNSPRLMDREELEAFMASAAEPETWVLAVPLRT